MNFKNTSTFDIKLEGRGIWYVIHTLALHANEKNKECFIYMINTLCDHFGYESCKAHFKKFLTDYPLRNYKPEEYFRWSYDFHNSVNVIINKPTISYEEAFTKYKNMVCKNCHGEKEKPTVAVGITHGPRGPILVPVDEKPKLNLFSVN